MDERDLLRAAMRSIAASERERLGEPPTPEEILAYREGTLPERDRQVLEEKLAAFPEAAEALADLASFPDVTPKPGVTKPSAEDTERSWQSFQKRLEQAAPPRHSEPHQDELPDASEASRWSTDGTPEAYVSQGSVLALSRPVAAMAASALLVTGLVGGYLAGAGAGDSALTQRAALLAPRVELVPRSAQRAAPEVVHLPAEADALHITFDLGPTSAELAPYQLQGFTEKGSVLWERGSLRPTRDGFLEVTLDRRYLRSGHTEIRVFSDSPVAADPPSKPAPVAEYDLMLTLD